MKLAQVEACSVKVLPSKNTVVASETIQLFGALVEHIIKNDEIRVNGRIDQS